MPAGDSAAQGGTDLISTNVLTSVNGTAVTGLEAQRVKVGYGADGALSDVHSGQPLPVAVYDVGSGAQISVKAASTGPAVGDTALVVTGHPLSGARALGAGSGQIGTAYATGTAAAASTALVAAPTVGLSIYVTDIECSNEGAAATRVSLLEGAAVKFARFIASAGGGGVTNLKTPWKLPAATALNYTIGTATTWHLTISYFTAP